MIGREELFALAAKPLGDREMQAAGAWAPTAEERAARDKELASFAKRAQKVWLPGGKTSANTNEAREHERGLKALNFDLEGSVEAAGGHRGALRS